MENFTADMVVIGSGPSGQKAAIQAAKLGKRLIVIEKDPDPGELVSIQALSLQKHLEKRLLI